MTELQETIEGFRLSPQQRRLWELMGGGVGAYRTRGRVLVEGPLDSDRLRAALAEMTARHEILRTVFACPSGLTIPLQVIREASEWDFEEISRPGRDADAVAVELDRSAEDAGGFELESGPLLRVRCATLSAGRSLLVLELPALCADAAGLAVLVRELGRAYAGEPAGDENMLQHVDLSEWLNEALEDEAAEAGREHWQAVPVSGSLGLSLPLEPPAAPATHRFVPGVVERPLGAELTARLARLARDFDASTDDVLFACWRILLGRLLAGQEPVLGVTSDGRSYAELEQAIGPFARVLPVSCRLPDGMALGDAVARLRDVRDESESWQECFSWEAFGASPTVGGPPPFLPFAFESVDETLNVSAGDVRFSLHALTACVDRFRVKLGCRRRAGGLVLAWHHDRERFSRTAARRLAQRFEVLLADALGRPEAAVGDLDVSGAAERHRLLVELNDTAGPRRPGPLAHQLFADVARERPTAPAVSFDGECLRYGELADRSERLARHLNRIGAGPGTPVAICLERSPAVPVAILGTLAAGAFYAPLEPEQPASRLSAMCAELRPVAVITRSRWSERFVAAAPFVLCLEDDGSIATRPGAGDGRRPAAPARAVEPEDLAYVLFTSGSTGRPKGVAVEHRQLLNHLHAVRRQLVTPSGGRFALVSTFAADLANTMLFPALVSGGCLDVLSEERAVDPRALADYFEGRPADCLKIVPSHLRALLSAERPSRLLPRRHLVVGGEALSWELVERISKLSPGCRVWNAYGPTETTVEVTLHEVEPKAAECPAAGRLADSVPIGRPLADTSFYLVDGALGPVPAGVAGELLIGGSSLARGYLGQPAKTARVFVPDAVGRPGQRLYRSGDVARTLADGTLDFLGRIDQQVKIHGFRIELGEIETALRRHPAVRDALAVLDSAASGSQRLVAYLILERAAAAPKVEALRAFLAETLLEPTIPALFAVLESFPLTPNGKLDRRALPAPDEARMRLSGTPVSPRTPVEAKLVAIWREVLSFDEIGIHDNFFALGGDSILSIQAVARANGEGLHVTPLDLFQHQTVALLAPIAARGEAVAAEQEPVVGELPLTPIQRRFFERRRIEPWHWNQSLLLAMRRPLSPARLEAAIGRLAAHHDALRLRFHPVEGGVRQVNGGPEAGVPFSRVDLSALAPGERSTALESAAAQVQTSLDLVAGPLVRSSCFELGHGAAPRLLLVVHHLAVDAVSWRVLLEDLAGAIDGREPPPKTTSFKAWAERLVDSADRLREEADYWLRHLPEEIPPLPVDRPGPVPALGQTATHTTALDEDTTTALVREVPAAHRIAVDEMLVAALARTLRRWTGARPVLLELEGHGRSGGSGDSEPSGAATPGGIFGGVDLSRTVGWFTTVYPVLLEVPAEPADDGELLRTVKETLRSVPRRGIGYGLLRYQGDEEIRRWLAERPQPEVRFNYLGRFDGALSEAAPFAPVDEPKGPERSPREPFLYRLDLVAFVRQGRLQIDWTYPRSLYRRSTIESLAESLTASLRRLLESCRSSADDYTPADFPEAELSQKDLHEVLEQLGEVGEL